jgi:uncharacterized protein (TIGR02246 family)
MTRRLPLVLMLLVSVVIGACSQEPPAPPPQPVANDPADIAALKAARAEFVAAYAASDAAAIGRLYAAHGVSEPNGQPTLKGRDAIVASLTAMFQQVSVKLDLKADETATLGVVGVDRGRYTATVTHKNDGSATTSEGRYLVVFVKEADGAWRVARDMDNVEAIVTPAAPETPSDAAPAVKK